MLLLAAGLSALTGVYLSQRLSDDPEAEIATVGLPATPAPPADISIQGKPRPDFSLPDLTGRSRHISEWDGQVLAINFWASWCLPCLHEIPELVDLQTRYADRGLQIIGIALQKPEEITDFIVEYKMNYPVLAGEDSVIEIAESYGNTIGALPYTVIIDRSGRIVFVKLGPVTGTEVEGVISPLL
jgi:peroxiredoxin